MCVFTIGVRVVHLSLLCLWDRIVSSSVRPLIITDAKGREGEINKGTNKQIRKRLLLSELLFLF